MSRNPKLSALKDGVYRSGRLLEVIGASLSCLGTSWVCLAASWGASGCVTGASWGLLVMSWGSFRRPPSASWGVLACLGASFRLEWSGLCSERVAKSYHGIMVRHHNSLVTWFEMILISHCWSQGKVTNTDSKKGIPECRTRDNHFPYKPLRQLEPRRKFRTSS